MVLFVVGSEKVEKSVVIQEADEGAVVGLMVSEHVLEAVVDSMLDSAAVVEAMLFTDSDVTSEAVL